MIKEIKTSQVDHYLLIAIVQHPIKEFGDFTIHVTKSCETGDYVFSIPSLNWVYIMKPEIEINNIFAPSGFNHPLHKEQLIELMNKLITIIPNT